jgi:hypothetical protein
MYHFYCQLIFKQPDLENLKLFLAELIAPIISPKPNYNHAPHRQETLD